MFNSASKRYKAAKDAANKANAEVKKVVKEALKEMVVEFFEKNPAIQSIGWNQYTPYFNDGDPCVFDANVDYPAFTFTAKDGKTLTYNAGSCELVDPSTATEEDEVEYEEANSIESDPYDKEIAKHEKIVTGFLHQFDNDDFEAMFGDHVEVTIPRKGKIEVEEYSHD